MVGQIDPTAGGTSLLCINSCKFSMISLVIDQVIQHMLLFI